MLVCVFSTYASKKTSDFQSDQMKSRSEKFSKYVNAPSLIDKVGRK